MNRACVGCSAAYGAGCIDCNDFGCIKTDPGYFISNRFSFSCSILPNDSSAPPLQHCCLTRNNSLCPAGHNITRSADGNRGERIAAYYNMNEVVIDCSKMTANCRVCGIEGDLAQCLECEESYVLVGGTCKACSEHVNNGQCSECTLTGCSSCGDNSLTVSNDGTCVSCEEDEVFDSKSKTCVKCQTLYHECNKCDANGCLSCESGVVLHDGLCKTCKAIHGSGCTECDSKTCHTCVDDQCCQQEAQIVTDESGEVSCGTCQVYGNECLNCSETRCSVCEDNYVVNPKSGKCQLCREMYEGCAKCNSDICLECEISSWTLTNYGCIDLNEYLPSSLLQSSSKLFTTSRSKDEPGHSVGIIVGIVIGLTVVGALVAIVVFVVKNKRGTQFCMKKGDDECTTFGEGTDSYEMEIV